MNRVRLGALLTACVLPFVACERGAAPVDHEVIEPDVRSLRAAFEADSGKVRALFLASPT